MRLFVAVGVSMLLTMAFHELGHDESQAWNIARAATWPWDVVANGRVEGHTPFWHAMLWPATLAGNPLLMQLLGVALSLGAAFMLLRDRPFPLSCCALIAFGYYPFYQYGIFPRPYSLALFLSAAVASSLYTQRGSFVFRALLCGLLAFTSAFGVAMSAGLMFLVITEALPGSWEGAGSNAKRLAPGLAIYATLVALSCWLVLFPLGSTAMEIDIASGGRIGTVGFLHALQSAFFPQFDRLPLGIGQWLYASGAGRLVMAVITYGCIAVFALWLWPRPAAVIAWLLAVMGVGFAAMYSGFHAERYAGHLFLAGLAIVWAAPGLRIDAVLSRRFFGRPIARPTSGRFDARHRLLAAVAVGILLYQAIINAAVSGLDIREVQSPWHQIARDLDQTIDGPFAVMTTFAYDAGALIAYLDEPVYDIRCRCWARFTAWDRARVPSTPEETRAQFCALSREHGTVVAVVTRNRWQPQEGVALIGEYKPGYRDSGDADVQVFRNAEAGSPNICQASD